MHIPKKFAEAEMIQQDSAAVAVQAQDLDRRAAKNKRRNLLQQHRRLNARGAFFCPHEDCPMGRNLRSFSRSDNMVQHRRLVHGDDLPKSLARRK
ncbi:hypothetical protein RUND412_007321 [Rhizina undulata]